MAMTTLLPATTATQKQHAEATPGEMDGPFLVARIFFLFCFQLVDDIIRGGGGASDIIP
jgi:hypothetical protein